MSPVHSKRDRQTGHGERRPHASPQSTSPLSHFARRGLRATSIAVKTPNHPQRLPAVPAAPPPCHQSHLPCGTLRSEHIGCADPATRAAGLSDGHAVIVLNECASGAFTFRAHWLRSGVASGLTCVSGIASLSRTERCRRSGKEYRVCRPDLQSCGLGGCGGCSPTDATRLVTYGPATRHKSGASTGCGIRARFRAYVCVADYSVTAGAMSHGPHDRWDDARRGASTIRRADAPALWLSDPLCCVLQADAAYHTGLVGWPGSVRALGLREAVSIM